MSKQEKLWQGDFGNLYHARNTSEDRTGFWRKVTRRAPFKCVDSVLEVGAGRGDNLVALRGIYGAKVWGVEINKQACEELEKKHITYRCGAFLDTAAVPSGFDLVITRGLLIHVPDDDVEPTLRKMYASTKRYIAIAEYYSPVRRQVKYRGHDEALWLDDYAGRLLEMYSDLKLIDYGFEYHLDGGYDLTWFLLEKE